MKSKYYTCMYMCRKKNKEKKEICLSEKKPKDYCTALMY